MASSTEPRALGDNLLDVGWPLKYDLKDLSSMRQPPENLSCPLCFNMGTTGRRIHGNILLLYRDRFPTSTFWNSAYHECLACRLILESVLRFTDSSTNYIGIELMFDYAVNTSSSQGNREPRVNIHIVHRSGGPIRGWNSHMEKPLWAYATHMEPILQVYSLPNTPSLWATIPQYSEPAVDSTSDAAAAVVLGWLHVCERSHSTCRQENTERPLLPTRVVYVGRNAVSATRLVLGGGRRAHYVALSWRWGEWGNGPTLTTTTENLFAHLAGRWTTAMPRLFSDAAQFARKLGIYYLWVDALCIIQNSASDWGAESVRMAEVYGNATLTIAADVCEGSHQGFCLFQEQFTRSSYYDIGLPCNRRRARHPLLYHFAGDAGTEIVSFRVRTVEGITPEGYHGLSFVWKNRLKKRAWCFQENILSRRILHLGATELSWQCLEMEACECERATRPPPTAHNRKTTDDILAVKRCIRSGDDANPVDTWLLTVEAFTLLGLTNRTDRLVAVDGLARMLAPRLVPGYEHFQGGAALAGTDYLYGTWATQITSQLAWFVTPPALVFMNNRAILRDSHRQTSTSMAPKWSWGSVTGEVKFVSWARFDVQALETVPSYDPDRSATTTALITRGRLWEDVQVLEEGWNRNETARCWRWRRGYHFHTATASRRAHTTQLNDPVLFDTWSHWTRGAVLNTLVSRSRAPYCALENAMGRGWALLLKKLDWASPDITVTTPSGVDLYERVGVIFPPETFKSASSTYELKASAFEAASIPEKVVAIV